MSATQEQPQAPVRDPHGVLVALAKAAKNTPELRICQLIVNATYKSDPFYVEDTDLIRALREYTRPPEDTPRTSCPHNPEDTFESLGPYRCPDCGALVFAGLPHPSDEEMAQQMRPPPASHKHICEVYGWYWKVNPQYQGMIEMFNQRGQMLAWIEKRPLYCDRGHYCLSIAIAPGLGIDSADEFPRYFMRLSTAMQECAEFMAWRMFQERADSSDARLDNE